MIIPECFVQKRKKKTNPLDEVVIFAGHVLAHAFLVHVAVVDHTHQFVGPLAAREPTQPPGHVVQQLGRVHRPVAQDVCKHVGLYRSVNEVKGRG